MTSKEPDSGDAALISSVLVIDDSQVQRDHTIALCRQLRIEHVHEAANGREALTLLDALEPAPELLIIDLEMPTMDGPELLEQLQQRGIDIPIVVGSSHERILIRSVQDMGSVLGLRILGALQKPLRLEMLRDALRKPGAAGAQPKTQAHVPVNENALRLALERGEIHVHFQPQADLRTGAVRGVEALARWSHPQFGRISPEQFIPLAERSDLIHALTIEVMNQAMFQVAAWRARGLHLSVALNLSPQLLDRSTIAKEIASLQLSHGLAAEQIVLEITEGSLVNQMGTALGVLARLRLRGFGLSIDDYGTGFSSMQMLARVPFTELKIDRSFVNAAHERENLRVILRSAIDMARELGLVSVAEGVETMQDWRLLQQFGCTLAQGWLIAWPMAGEEIGPWLRAYRARRTTLRGRDLHADASTEDASGSRSSNQVGGSG
jgi:EAL domain-containing protein (putative c-di-GMP-specific phosphodiesterase class I)